ncbi:uncharacterized protein LOC128224239 [Mya arenaria]|uniref:uncharacterized protein LOC128224145 n=1 Tax=Mya arenaria TaxID=6604 RepID=UPI0022E2408C|nr:uncharacterized protein LOC128224145 [Mya arenaria]XP_052789991.1 uncharacterized protein LOC128224239 [Mya arenaria]
MCSLQVYIPLLLDLTRVNHKYLSHDLRSARRNKIREGRDTQHTSYWTVHLEIWTFGSLRKTTTSQQRQRKKDLQKETMELDEIIAYKLKTATYVIELDVFSGQPNPIIEVSEDKRQDIKIFDNHRTFQSSGLASTPGYRGFIVHKRTSHKRATLEIIKLTVGKGKSAYLESKLLRMFPGSGSGPVSRQVYTHVEQWIDVCTHLEMSKTSANSKEKKGKGDPTQLYQLPDYNPDLWNTSAITRLKNSTYNYATNIQTNTFSKPGRGNGVINWGTTQHILDGCNADGLKERTDGELPSERENTGAIALAVWYADDSKVEFTNQISDFIFYRQDSDMMWSYKSGQKSVTNRDGDGKLISNPSKAALHPFRFVCYFGNNSSVHIC